jgi:hypothetical protein
VSESARAEAAEKSYLEAMDDASELKQAFYGERSIILAGECLNEYLRSQKMSFKDFSKLCGDPARESLIEQAAQDIIQLRNVVAHKPVPKISWDGMRKMIDNFHPGRHRKEILEVIDIIKRKTVKALPFS